MNASSKILLAVTAVGALSVVGPAFGNLMINAHSSNASQAGDFAGLTVHSSFFQALLGSPNSGHLSRMLETMPDRTSLVTITLADVDRDLLRLNVLQFRLRGDLKDALRVMTGTSTNDPGRIAVNGRLPVDESPKPVDILPVPNTPPGVSVPEGGSTLLLLGFALLGLAALRPRLSF